MADFLIQAIISNLVVSSVLAIIAWGVQRRIRSAGLANLLWAIVLVKMVTPPMFAVPMIEVASVSKPDLQPVLQAPQGSVSVTEEKSGDASVGLEATSASSVSLLPADSSGILADMSKPAFSMWLVISTIMFVVSMIRILRFHWILRSTCRVHQKLTESLSANAANQMSLCRTPRIVATGANVAPFVWWMAGRSVIVLSDRAIQQLSNDDLRFVVTHEMAHIRRRDHWFRWLEWLALIGFWWNPVMWWARTQLRISEEMACDALVLEATAATFEKHQYANSLLNVAELLVSSAVCPPVVASAINSGGCLEKRLKMIMTQKLWKVPTNIRMTIVMVAACVFPLGVVAAQDLEAVEKRLGGAVEAGELTLEQAGVMMNALRQSSAQPREMAEKKRRYMEFQREITAAVKAGKLSEVDAEDKLISVRREMFEGHGEHDDQHNMESKKRHYMEFEREIAAAVRAGKLSEEDAEDKLIAVRREIFQGHGEHDDQHNMEARRRRYMEFEHEIAAAVRAGELSEEDAEDKLIAVRRELFEGQGEQYRTFVDQMEAAVEAGRLTEEEAEEKLIELRRELFHALSERDDRRNNEAKKRHYRNLVDEIEAALEAGKISEEDAEQKLVGLRKKMFSEDQDEDYRDAEMEGRMQQYREFELSIKSDLENGELKPKQAEKKLIEMRRQIFHRDRQPKEERSDRQERSEEAAKKKDT